MLKRKKIIFILFFANIFFALDASVHDSISYFSEFKLHYGFIMPHHKNMQHLTTGHFTACELNFNFQTQGEKKWQCLYKYPVIGGAIWYADLANPQVLGKAISAYPYMNFHLYNQNNFFLNYRFGIGLAYISKPFNYADNYKNIAIGSHLNAAINMFYECKWLVKKKVSFTSGIGITHFSNGSFKTPNLGINIPTIFAGVAYYFPSKINFQPDTSLKNIHEKNTSLRIYLAGGMKQLYPALGDNYGVFMASFNCYKSFSYKREMAAGIDVYMDYSDKRVLKRKGILLKNDLGILKPGLYAGHNFVFSHLRLLTHLGYYLYAKDKSDGMVYSRFGLEYNFNNNLFAHIALKTHFAKADFIEWGIGYTIK